MHSILLIQDNKTWNNGVWLVHNDFWIIQFASNLSIHAVVPWWWTSAVLTVRLKAILPSRAHVTQKHGSVAVGTLCVVVTLRGVRCQVEALSKSLEIDVLPDASRVQARARYSTDSTIAISTRSLKSCNVAGKLCSMKVFLDCLVTEALSVCSPFPLPAFVADCKYSQTVNCRMYSFLPGGGELAGNPAELQIFATSDESKYSCKRKEDIQYQCKKVATLVRHSVN